MARTIDAMQAVTKLSARILPLIRMGANPTQIYNEMLQVLAEAPTVDAVPVVRCCQCSKRYDADECPMCHLVEGEYNEYTADDGFCDRGERRTDGATMDLEVKDA